MKRFGQGLIEYSLIIGLIAIVAMAALSATNPTTGTDVELHHKAVYTICNDYDPKTGKCKIDEILIKLDRIDKSVGR